MMETKRDILTNEQVNTARTVRAGATVPELCMHNVMLGQGCFCPRCPTASYVSAPDSVPNPVSTLRLLAKCGSMDLSALDGIADEFEHLDADAAGLQAELVSVKACWADMITQCDHWLEIAREKDAELERLRNIIHGCPVCSELERNIQPSHEPGACAPDPRDVLIAEVTKWADDWAVYRGPAEKPVDKGWRLAAEELQSILKKSAQKSGELRPALLYKCDKCDTPMKCGPTQWEYQCKCSG